jgi:putative transposase
MVFSNKNREPCLTKEIIYKVQKQIIKNCSEKKINLSIINGYTDHLHCLISLGKEQCVSKVAQMIKGESSYCINNNNLIIDKFCWHDDYFAVFVSESQAESDIKYIENQETYHSKITFEEEASEFMKKYRWKVKFT